LRAPKQKTVEEKLGKKVEALSSRHGKEETRKDGKKRRRVSAPYAGRTGDTGRPAGLSLTRKRG